MDFDLSFDPQLSIVDQQLETSFNRSTYSETELIFPTAADDIEYHDNSYGVTHCMDNSFNVPYMDNVLGS